MYTDEMTLEQFRNDALRIDAVIRNLEIIGEAAGHIPLEVQEKYPHYSENHFPTLLTFASTPASAAYSLTAQLSNSSNPARASEKSSSPIPFSSFAKAAKLEKGCLLKNIGGCGYGCFS